MPFLRKINLGAIDFVESQKKTLDIPRDGPCVQYNLRVQFTITNAATGPVGPEFQTLARLIRRVEVILGGRDTVVSISGESLAARAAYEWAAVQDGMEDTVVLTDSAATVYDITIPIPRFLPRSRTPLMTADDLRRVKQATFEVTWGTEADMFTTPGAAAISLVTANVEAEYLMDVAPDVGFQVRQLTEITQQYTASNSALAVTIDGQTGLLLRSIAVGSLVANIGSNTPLAAGSVEIKAAALVYHKQLGPMIQAGNKREFGQESLITGFYYIPFTWAGDSGLMINTSSDVLPADLKAIFDVTFGSGAHELLISVESVRPPKFA